MVLRGLNLVQIRSFSDILFGTKNLWLEIFTRRAIDGSESGILVFQTCSKERLL